MKANFLAFMTALSASTGALAQGMITADNANGFGGPTATSFGLFFNADGSPCTVPAINITILGGPNPSSLSPIVTLTGANAILNGGVFVDPRYYGLYFDPSSDTYTVPGVVMGIPAPFKVLAWVGSAPTFDDAPITSQFWPWNGTAYVNPTTFTFLNPTGYNTIPQWPASLDGMPAMVLMIPEPSFAALAGLGSLALLRNLWLPRRELKMRIRMNKTILILMAAVSFALRALAQGIISADNFNGFGGATATSYGLFFNADGTPCALPTINVAILGGPNPGSLSPIVTLTGANALVSAGDPRWYGMYFDPSVEAYTVPGVYSGNRATVRLLAWVGSAPTFADAPINSQFWPWNGTTYVNPTTFTFLNPTGGAEIPPTPRSLDGMPAMVLMIPEPSFAALAGLGSLALLRNLRLRR